MSQFDVASLHVEEDVSGNDANRTWRRVDTGKFRSKHQQYGDVVSLQGPPSDVEVQLVLSNAFKFRIPEEDGATVVFISGSLPVRCIIALRKIVENIIGGLSLGA